MRHLLLISPSKRKAFTLIEILVASVILVIIVGSMAVIFSQANRSWSETEARLQVYQNTREVINAISRDIACAYQSTSTVVKFDYDNIATDTLYFTAAVNTNYDTNEYDLSIIGYKIDTATNTVKKYKEDYDGTQAAGWTPTSGNWSPLAENITGLAFEFYDADQTVPGWLVSGSKWNSSVGVKDYLPQAVKITVDAEDKQARFSRTFNTTIYIQAY